MFNECNFNPFFSLKIIVKYVLQHKLFYSTY
jgi:hypothetical protein